MRIVRAFTTDDKSSFSLKYKISPISLISRQPTGKSAIIFHSYSIYILAQNLKGSYAFDSYTIIYISEHQFSNKNNASLSD
jgi:hypothetical protein